MTGRDPAIPGLALRARPIARIWILAAAGAMMLHLGVVALIWAHMQPDDSDDETGAPAIEISLDLAAPRVEASDLPPGPEAEASTAAPAIVEQKEMLEKSELPRDTPIETDSPDQVVSPDATKAPTEKDPVIKASEAAPSSESVAVEATAPPSSESPVEAQRSTAPAQGLDQSALRLRTTWQKQLIAHFNRHKRYPSGQQPRNAEILVSFTLDRLGHVVAANVVKSSGDASYDAAAVSMIHRSDPVPQPPPLVADQGLTFTLPVVFRTNRGH